MPYRNLTYYYYRVSYRMNVMTKRKLYTHIFQDVNIDFQQAKNNIVA